MLVNLSFELNFAAYFKPTTTIPIGDALRAIGLFFYLTEVIHSYSFFLCSVYVILSLKLTGQFIRI